ncbi:uncharacterized protein LOC121804840 [Salvia splendens]|uniref:uncharacterized protein LOC121804840 n=1 Tax=Salvia splendens TaxID=180675 RepID=UPI001C263F12|nr:uncharacterized protein LOC121804840 [Salvia splendens]
MIEEGLRISGEAERMDYRPSQRSAMDVDVPVRQKAKRRTKKKTACGESSSQPVHRSDDDFVEPPPPRSAVRGRHSVSHTGGTGEDIGLSDVPTSPPRSSVQDDFFGVDLENAVVQDTPPSRIPRSTSKIGKGIRGLFMRKRRDD